MCHHDGYWMGFSNRSFYSPATLTDRHTGVALSWCPGRERGPTVWRYGKERGSSRRTGSVGWPHCLSNNPGPQFDLHQLTAPTPQVLSATGGHLTRNIYLHGKSSFHSSYGQIGECVCFDWSSTIGAAPGRGSCPIQRPLTFDLIYTDYHGLAHLHGAMGLAFPHYRYDHKFLNRPT